MKSAPKGSTPGLEQTLDLSNVSSVSPPAIPLASVISHEVVNEKGRAVDIETPQSYDTHSASEDDVIYPEGGWEAWGVVLGGFAAMVRQRNCILPHWKSL